jgi:hypothetical protein
VTVKPLDKRIYHPYWKWEEIRFNMWGTAKNKEATLKEAIEFTGLHCLYGIFMRRVIHEWQYSCEHNLSAAWQNRKAWLGHAACALAMGCPEDIVRHAWSFLNEDQQIAANKQADNAIVSWEGMQCQK